MKKKLLSTLLCAAMAVSMLAGCGGSDSNAAADNSTASDATETTASADKHATEPLGSGKNEDQEKILQLGSGQSI